MVGDCVGRSRTGREAVGKVAMRLANRCLQPLGHHSSEAGTIAIPEGLGKVSALSEDTSRWELPSPVSQVTMSAETMSYVSHPSVGQMVMGAAIMRRASPACVIPAWMRPRPQKFHTVR